MLDGDGSSKKRDMASRILGEHIILGSGSLSVNRKYAEIIILRKIINNFVFFHDFSTFCYMVYNNKL